MCQNIDEFNRLCGLIFIELYRAFPKPVNMAVYDLDECEDTPEHERQKKREDRAEITSYAIEFLSDEDYLTFTIRAGHDADSQFSAVRLTSKGFLALGKTPESLQGRQRAHGDRLIDMGKDVLKTSAITSVSAIIRDILSRGGI